MTLSITEFLQDRIEEDRKLAQDSLDSREGTDCWFDTGNPHIVDHYVRHEPERVLREVAAKRRLVELFEITSEEYFGGSEGFTLMRDAVRQLASVYEGHEDYREERKP